MLGTKVVKERNNLGISCSFKKKLKKIMEGWNCGWEEKRGNLEMEMQLKKAAIEWHGYRLAKYLWYRANKIKAKKNNIVKASWLLLLRLSFLLQKICFLPVSKGDKHFHEKIQQTDTFLVILLIKNAKIMKLLFTETLFYKCFKISFIAFAKNPWQ